MKNIVLNLPTLLFVVGTRAALAFGSGLLVSTRMTNRNRRRLGLALVAVGIVSTVPAALIVFAHSGRSVPDVAARAHALRLF